MIEKENLLPLRILINNYIVLINHALIFHTLKMCESVPMPQTFSLQRAAEILGDVHYHRLIT